MARRCRLPLRWTAKGRAADSKLMNEPILGAVATVGVVEVGVTGVVYNGMAKAESAEVDVTNSRFCSLASVTCAVLVL